MKQQLLFITLLVSLQIFAQLDTIHWFPPLHSKSNAHVGDHYMYLSTPEPTAFAVTITDGSGAVIGTPTISQGNPYKFLIGDGPGTKAIISASDLNTVLTDRGLILTADKKFYANFRVRSNVQAGSLTCKGTAAKGTIFRAGVVPMQASNNNIRNFVFSFIATEDNTTVNISDYDSNVEFYDVNGNITSDNLTINLNAGNTYVLSGYVDGLGVAANAQGFTGALVKSNKPLVVNSGNMCGSIASPINQQDIMIDQTVSMDQLGNKYILIRGAGTDAMERPLVIATEDNTQIFVNGSTTAIATINAGDWFLVPSSYYAGTSHKNMYIEASKNIYMYQPLGGTADARTPGLNFIPPVSCFLPKQVDLIPDVSKIGDVEYNGAIIVFTEAGSVFKINGVVQTGAETVTGNPAWVTYSISGLSGNCVMTSTGSMAVGIFGYNGIAGFAGYYSGFGKLPVIKILGDNFCHGESVDLTTINTFDEYNWSSGDITQEINVDVGNQYFVTVTDNNGCEAIDSIDIMEYPLPIPVVTGSNFCSGQTVSLTTTESHNSYIWNTTDTTQSITINTGGIYSVAVTDTNDCQADTSITIIEYPLPIPIITGDNFCSGQSTSLITTEAYDSYIWNTTDTTQSITINTGGTYNLTVTDAHNCVSDTSITIIEYPLPIPVITGLNFCSGESSVLTTTETYDSYIWNTTDITQSITIDTGGTYTITVTDAHNCQADTNITIIEYPLPTPIITGDNFCSGESSVLTTTETYNSYIWNTTNTTPSITISTGGSYNLTVTDANNCKNDTSITIIEYPLPTPIITGDNFCSEQSSILNETEVYDSYIWNTTETTQTITINIGGTYSITVTDTNNCKANASIDIIEYPLPIPVITGVNFCSGESSVLTTTETYNLYIWNTTDITQSITINTGGTYVITVTDANNCQADTSITIIEYPLPIPVITGNNFCFGQSSILSTTETYASYIWNTTNITPSITVETGGTYNITVTDAHNCQADTNITIIEYPLPTPSITGIDLFCVGDSVALSVNSVYSNYEWNTNDSTQSIIINNAGTYTVTVTDVNNCEETTNFIANQDSVTLETSGEITICKGFSTTILADASAGTPPYSYYWCNNVNETTQNVTPSETTTYCVYSTDNVGCVSDTQHVVVTVSNGVELDVFTNKDTICPGDPLLITDLVSYGMPPYTIYDENNDVVSLNYVAYPEEDGTFPYTVVDACGSTDTSDLTINFYPIPDLQLQADILQGCPPLTVHFNEESLSGSAQSYLWNFDDLNDNNLSISSNPYHIFNSSGYYDITVSIITADGCKLTKTVDNMINVYPSPKAKFEVLPSVVTILKPSFDFDNYSEGASYYVWDFDDGDMSNIFEPRHTYKYVGDYNVELVAVSDLGCKDTAMYIIRVKEIFTLYVPTAFSPDYDRINDGFRAVGTGIDLDNYNLLIYDRWGELIWKSYDLFEYWDGHAKGGEKRVQNGSYVWKVVCKDFEGNEHEKAGVVTVIR